MRTWHSVALTLFAALMVVGLSMYGVSGAGAVPLWLAFGSAILARVVMEASAYFASREDQENILEDAEQLRARVALEKIGQMAYRVGDERAFLDLLKQGELERVLARLEAQARTKKLSGPYPPPSQLDKLLEATLRDWELKLETDSVMRARLGAAAPRLAAIGPTGQLPEAEPAGEEPRSRQDL